MLIKTLAYYLLLLATPILGAVRKNFADSQVITEGEMTNKEYTAHIEFLKLLLTNDEAAHQYCDSHLGHSFFNIFKISARCPKPMIQHPSHGRDGSKFACAFADIPKPCVVYSFGSGNDFTFEDDVAPFGCEIHTFDCYSSGNRAPMHVKYHPWCVDGRDHGNHYKIPTIMKLLNHRKVDYLKIDVEGAEYPSLLKLEELSYDSRPTQIAVEIHPWPDQPHNKRSPRRLRETIQLMLSLHRMGYRLLSREDNMPHPCCSEFVYGLPGRLPVSQSPYPYGFAKLQHRPTTTALTASKTHYVGSYSPRPMRPTKETHYVRRYPLGAIKPAKGTTKKEEGSTVIQNHAAPKPLIQAPTDIKTPNSRRMEVIKSSSPPPNHNNV